MKLQDLFQLPIYQNARVIAGRSGLNRLVKSVNMMDAPDIADYLKADVLLLTTGYAIRDHPDELYRLVQHMTQSGCAGLGIKTKRFLNEIPQQVLDLADANHFPVIELSLDYSLGELLHESLSYMVERHNEHLRYALKTHRDFSQMVIQGQNIASIINALSPLVGGTVLLIDGRLQTIASSGAIAPLLEVQLQRVAQHLLTLKGEYSSPFIRLCPLSGDPSHYAEALFYRIGLPQQTCFLIVVAAQLDDDASLPKLALEQAANVIGFELMKQQAVKEKSRRYKNEFCEDLVEGRFHSAAEMIHQGKRYGLQEPYPCLGIVCKVDDAADTAGDHVYSKRDHIYGHIKRMLVQFQQPYILFNKKDLFVILLKWEQNLPMQEYQLSERLLQFQEKLYQADRISMSFGIGNPVEHLTLIPNTYNEALGALTMGYKSRQTRFIQSYRAKEAVELLKMIPREALQDFYEESFHLLADLETREREELMNTVLVYLETHGQIAETSKRLFVHRNTVAYRINKFEQLTHRNLRDANDSMRFRLAFLTDKILRDIPQ
ncbi:PucR family transcriptional regulator [Paenibacillaceae bacterium]|nr:PucR family transcriptional regulator [Paenibacillaceae bacterium]